MRALFATVSGAVFAFTVTFAHAQTGLVTVKFAEGSRNFNVLPVYVAIQQGYFAAEGLKPELITLKGGPAAASALMTGDVDIGITLTESVMRLREQDKNLMVAAVIQDRNPCVIVVPTGSTAKSLADLKGQTIGVTAVGSLTDLILRAYIAEQGFSASDFKIVGFGQPATVNLALERQEIQAAVTVTPFLTRMQLKGTARILADFRDRIYPGQSMLVRTSDLSGGKRPLFEKIVRVVQNGMNTLYGDETKTVAAARAFFPNMEPDLLAAAIKDDTQTHKMFAKDLSVTPEAFDKWQQELLQAKLLKVRYPYDSIFAKWK
ncbi:MAG: ABC transporter substrate-binding protein [Sphingobium sp.]